MASDLNPYEFLWIVKESAYGTTMNAPSAGTDSIYIRLAGGNRFTMRPKPLFRKIPFGGGWASLGYAVADKFDTTGRLQVELCYSQAKLLLDWGTTRIDNAQTSPWTTTEPIGDLASCSVFHGIARSDGTIKRRKYLGCKVLSWSLASSTQTGVVMLNMNLRAQKPDASDPNSTAFPAPADTAFPTDFVLHNQLTTTYGGSGQSYVVGLTPTCDNSMDNPYFGGSVYPAMDRIRGRAVKCETEMLYTASPDWRATFEALTRDTLTAVWTNSANTISLDFQSLNIVDSVEDELEPGKLYYQRVNFETHYDTSSSKLIAFTYA